MIQKSSLFRADTYAIYIYGYEDSYGDRDRWSKEENLSYTVEGNTIITEEISEWGYGLTLTYSGGNLIDGSDVYVYDGTVDLDPSLDNTVLPEGKRSYIPEGWYESGRAESWFELNVNGYIQAGDIVRIAREANSNPYLGDYTAIHIADENTIEFAAATCSTQKPSTGYYATKNYGDWENNCTVYFYYTYATETLKYKMVDDVVYVKTDQGWLKYSIVVSNNSIATQLFTYKKINYSGGYAW